jgi:hypothetical protein
MDKKRIREDLSKWGEWSYRKLSSMRVSVYILALLLPFYVLGTIFPQGGDIGLYEEAGGKLLGVVRLFDLLNIFQSPWFLVPALLLFTNILVCAYDRFFSLIIRTGPVPETLRPEFIIPLGSHMDEAAVERVLEEKLGFRDVPPSGGGKGGEGGKGSPWKVKEKGFSYRWLTWLYHFGFVMCFVGFILTGLFLVEGTMTLEKGEPEGITSDEEEKLGWFRRTEHAIPDFKLVLDEFITEYTELPQLDYPEDNVSRLAVALGWKAPSYRIKAESLFPKDWKSALRVVRDDETVYEKTIEVNDPLRFGGYTFYQVGFEQILKIGVDKNPILLETKTNEELELPGIEGSFKFGTLRTGTLTRIDGTVEKLKPFVMVKRTIKDGDKERTEELGKLELKGSITVKGRKVRFAGAREDSVLSYRYDPGVPLLWVAGILVFSVMSLRCFGRWYMLAYRVEEVAGARNLLVWISGKGLSADPEKLRNRLGHYLAGL